MKELVVSNCEKEFVLKALTEGIRLDGRNLDEWRRFEICFGSDSGSCHVSLGNTRVVAHVTCKVAQPKQTRPNEGLLYINVELGTMGAPNFEANKQSELGVYLNRLLEKCLKEAKCLDLESLCIVSEEKVWNLRVDIHILNHAGNLIECASIAAITSLAHFKRPDFTIDGEHVHIHTLEEKDPIPTVVHHYPICVSFGIFNNGTVISDPNLLEETVCSMGGALFVIGMNSFREICLLDLTGAGVTSQTSIIYKATNKATARVKYVVDEIKKCLAEDTQARSRGEKVGFSNAISNNKLLTHDMDSLVLKLRKFDVNMEKNEESVSKTNADRKRKHSDSEEPTAEEMAVVVEDDVIALVSKDAVESGKTIWAKMENDPSGSEDESKEVQFVKEITDEDRIVDEIKVSSDSEEEDVVILENKN